MNTTQPRTAGTRSLVFLLLVWAPLLSCGNQAGTPAVLPEPGTLVSRGYVEIDSVKLYFEITGKGEPLLLLHGGLGGSEHFKEIIPLLAGSFKVITVDRRGHGRSYDNAEPYSYATMADEMKAFLDHLEIESANMLGFSDGGVVGYHLASTYPQVVKKLVAVGANFRVDGMTQEALDFTRNRLTPENLGEILPEIEESYRATNPQPENFSEFVRRSNALWLRDPYLTDQQMMGIQAPVLLMVGENDAIRIEHVLEMRALVENSHLCVLPDATHFVLSEKTEVVVPILMDFFGRSAGGASRSR